MTTYKGSGTVANLDVAAGTSPLTHSGFTMLAHKKAPPWVIPLGAIEGVEVIPKSLKQPSGALRVIVRDGIGAAESIHEDVNALAGGSRGTVDAFAAEIESARAGVAPCDMPVSADAAPVSAAKKAQDQLDAFKARRAEVQEKKGRSFEKVSVRNGSNRVQWSDVPSGWSASQG